MAFIPVTKTFTTQSDFEDPLNTRLNVDTSTIPDSILLPKTTIQNIQFINQSNSFRQNLLTNLIQSSNSLKLLPFQSHFINVVPVRSTSSSEDSLQLDFSPILNGSLTLKADGLTLVENSDYTWDPSTGKIILYSRLSATTIFEASYISLGILECEGLYESLPIGIGDNATQLVLSNTGTNLSSINFYIKQATTTASLVTASYQLFNPNNPVSLLTTSKFIQLKLVFTPVSFAVTTIPVTFKSREDWNLLGSVLDNVVINNQNHIEILSSTNSINNVTSLPVPTTLAGADTYKDPSTNDPYLIVVGGYESPTTLGKSVRVSKINSNGILGSWKDTSPLPDVSSPYNTTKTVTIGSKTFIYSLNNNHSPKIYRSIAAPQGVTPWTTENPLPASVYRANLEIIKNEVTHDYFIVVQNLENIYWIKINNIDGTIPGDWHTFKLQDIQEAASTALVQTSPTTSCLYVLGGVIQDSLKKNTTDKITKVNITQNSSSLAFSISSVLQRLPKKISHFTSELITVNSDSYLYIFGGTNQIDTFGDGNNADIQRIKIDPISGNFLESGFSHSPNKLYVSSSGLNTVLVSNNSVNNIYVIGDSSRSSSRVSSINILPSMAALKTGTYTSGIFQVPGCNLQYNTFTLNTTLFNNNQSINSFYRISDTQSNLLASSWVPISNNSNLTGNNDDRFIQFQFVLNRDPNMSQEEQSPTLNDFTFTFTSQISTLNQSPTYTTSSLTFDNFLYEPSGLITLRYDSGSNHTTYTDIPVTQSTPFSDETSSIIFRTDDSLPLSGPFLTMTDLHNNDAGGKYIEAQVELLSSADRLFSPVIQDITITGLQPSVTNESVGGFVIDEVPIGDQDTINKHYTTAFIYEPGSLEVYLNGQKQTKPLIFTENIDQASFDFVSYSPDSLDVLRVSYIKAL